MHWKYFFLSISISAAAVSAGRSLRHVGRQDPERPAFAARSEVFARYHEQQYSRRSDTGSVFMNANTSKYAVDGTAIPDVNFDIGESFAGLLPISDAPNDTNQLYFWFFPSNNTAAKKEILVWLNGGPGCSSLEGLLQENGPFLWQYGTFEPVPNPWAWRRLTNMVYVDQPIGTGFSQGNVTAVDEEDVAKQFMGFWKNFIDLFSMQGYKVYITGESYAGMYCPYIASAMLDAKDTNYFDVSGMMIYDPSIANQDLQGLITAVAFIDYWGGLFPFNDTFQEDIHRRSERCGFTGYLDEHLVYPPTGLQPVLLPSQRGDGDYQGDCGSLLDDIQNAILDINPCWDVYQVATTCPLLWDVLGFPGSFPYLPAGAEVYFNRSDVQRAINAPATQWEECASGNVFATPGGNDLSLPSAMTVLGGVVDRTRNVVVGHGALDMVLIANGTLLAIQNMTWGGALGFRSRPTAPFYVPYHDAGSDSTLAGAGVFGTVHSERGLTFVEVDLSGHMIPQYAPSASFRHLEFLLDRVDSLSSLQPFTVDIGGGGSSAQSTQPLGDGTAPQEFSTNSSATVVPPANASTSSTPSLVPVPVSAADCAFGTASSVAAAGLISAVLAMLVL